MLTKEQLQAVINEKLDNTLYWLKKAYQVRPQDDQSEQTLLNIMASLQKMQGDVNRALIDQASSTGIEYSQQKRDA